MGGAQEQGPKEEAGANVLRVQGATSGAGQGCCPQSTLPFSSPGRVSHASGDVYVCVRLCPLKAVPGLILSPDPTTTCPRLVSSILVPPGARHWQLGACGMVSERSLRVQAPGAGAGSWGDPSLCPVLAPMRPALLGHPFLLSFNTFIPALTMGRKVS